MSSTSIQQDKELRNKLKSLFIDYGNYLVIGGTITLDELLDEAMGAVEARDKELVRRARLDEVERIPNPGYITSNGLRVNQNENYKNKRREELSS